MGKDELMKNAISIPLNNNPIDEEEEKETLEKWLEKDNRLERLQEQFIQENYQEFLEMLRNKTIGENDKVKDIFCEEHKEKFIAFCEEKRKEKEEIRI